MEQMPMWCPPTPPQQDTDVYVDQTLSFLYDTTTIMTEVQLPPVYIRKENNKRSRHEIVLSSDGRRSLKMHRKDESAYAPRSLFERPSPALVKMRRDLKLHRYRGIVRPPIPLPGVKPGVSKPVSDPQCSLSWTIHEDTALLRAIQMVQGFPLNVSTLMPGHIPNWDLASDYVNTVSVTFRSAKQCRYRYENILLPREEGKQVYELSPRKKKNKVNLYKFPVPVKSARPMRTSQLYTQDNNASYSQVQVQRYESARGITNKRVAVAKSAISHTLMRNPRHAAVLNECGVDLDNPIMPSDVAVKRAERVAREKKMPDLGTQRLLIKPGNQAQQTVTGIQAGSSGAVVVTGVIPQNQVVASVPQVTIVQTTSIVTAVTTTISTTPGTPPNVLRTQRNINSPIQSSSVVSVSGLSPVHLQAGAQRLLVTTGTPGQAKTIVGGTSGTIAGKTINPVHLQMVRQTTLKQQQQLRLQSSITSQAVKATPIPIGGQQTVQVQLTQAQPRAQVSYVKPGIVTLTGKQGLTRTVTESEMNQLLKQRQLQQQQHKVLTTAATGQTATLQNISSQGLTQTIQQTGTSSSVATLIKTVSNSGGTQTVTLPVTISTMKALASGTPIKATSSQQLRQMQIQQHLLTQKKLNQKITGIGQVAGKAGLTQLIVGQKQFTTPITMHQFQHVIKNQLAVQQHPVMLAKGGTSRVIPMATAQVAKPTIQVVATNAQGIALRPQNVSTLAGALTGVKLQANVNQAHLLTQVTTALQNQNVRQGSPVRIQTSGSAPLVAVTVPSGSSIQQGVAQQQSSCSNVDKDQVSKHLKK